jgi:hypothetical protein
MRTKKGWRRQEVKLRDMKKTRTAQYLQTSLRESRVGIRSLSSPCIEATSVNPMQLESKRRGRVRMNQTNLLLVFKMSPLSRVMGRLVRLRRTPKASLKCLRMIWESSGRTTVGKIPLSMRSRRL